jgi:RHS repeat-associated protein
MRPTPKVPLSGWTGWRGAGHGNPNIPPIVEILYGYDMAGNRLTALDDRPGQAQPLSHQYAYDGLQRLVEAKRGVASSGSVTAGEFSQRWRDGSGNVTLDSLGNWYQSWTDYRGDGYGGNTSPDFDQRTHEGMNRIVTQKLAPAGTTVDLGVGATPDFDYDDASNLRSHKIWNGTGTSTTTLTYKHDAWNRLVEVDFGASVRSLQGYNALHWRTCKVADAIGAGTGPTLGPNGAIDQVRLMYYDSNWRLLEERVDDGAASTTTLAKLYDGTWAVTGVDRTQQNLWGLRYIDDIVLHRADRNKDGDYVDIGTDGTWYHLTDAQFSTVCVTDDDANVVERVTYSAYGIARHHWMADVNGDGAVTTSGSTSDRGIINGIAGQVLANRTIGGSAYRAEADLDRSGVIDTTDRGLASTAVAARPDGQVTDISATGADNGVGWDGYGFNTESALYAVRFRSYSPGLGRWIESDPAGYVDGPSLYEYTRGSPAVASDSLGLSTDPGWTRLPGRAGNPPPQGAAPPTCPCRIDLTISLTQRFSSDFASIVDLPIGTIRTHGMSPAEIANAVDGRLGRGCCIETLYIDAHNSAAGSFNFADGYGDDGLRSRTIGPGGLEPSPPLAPGESSAGPGAAKRAADRELERAAIERLFSRVCPGGRIVLVQCHSGDTNGPTDPGAELGKYLARKVGRGVTIELFSGNCRWAPWDRSGPLPADPTGRKRSFIDDCADFGPPVCGSEPRELDPPPRPD